MESKEKINELEDELEYEFRPCGTMMMQRLMTKWTPEEREKSLSKSSMKILKKH
ncbi:MAG: hypothetical protein IE918_08050 [Campylobacterales bacterium]|nr:hypothetical protein [Campylobacterales bacterium]